MIFSVVYLLACCLLGCMMVLARREASRDAELLVLRHENAVLRRQIGRVRYQPADRLWLAALSAGRERAPAIRDHHERIGDRDVGPPCRQREQHAVLVVEVNPVLAPVLAVRDELEVPAEQRMEPVRHPDTSVPIIWMGCS